uniref:EF-hand domain-containing protein n=1 Tax=Roseihalotalea indica TaxID=2867963 RepID=A0AA49JGK3_9BACT|nr:hypothetical protein K4G66_01685 [Tunicatimonas sp. TK19036]
MEYTKKFFKRLPIYCVSAGIIAFTAAGCGSSNEEQTAQTDTDEQVEQPVEAQPEMQESAQTADQSAMEDVETQEVMNPAPAIERNSAEFERLAAMKEANRNNEVLAGINVRYGDWDNDGDNVLNESEFFKGFYSVWDNDNDDVVNEEEFQTATENLFVNYDFDQFGEFSDWDADGNGELTEQEFDNGMNQAIQTNNDPEAVNRLFTVWDLDNDKKIERIELGNVTVLLDADNN